ncbi:MAG: DUF455 family protein [Bdellovibrionales bacterium]|nr:DUF455 family protein [Bdellovibrionales bacterium]
MTSSLLFEHSVFKKISLVENECELLLQKCTNSIVAPQLPGRDTPIVVDRAQLPRRRGLSTAHGQAHLLHDLANIELQAMELGIRTLHEFPDAPTHFREELVSVVLDEARHLKLCIQGIENLGFNWGDLPVLANLWTATSASDSLLDRVLIVHCYLEGSGLDSGELILNKLNGVENPVAREIVKTIADEEIRHVKFGLDWYRKFCADAGLSPADDFGLRLKKLSNQIPTRTTRFSIRARTAAGFDENMLTALRTNSPR